MVTLLDVVLWGIEAGVVFVSSTLLFDALHWLLHRWGKSKMPLLRTFSRWHWVHHAFLDRRMRVHPELKHQNLLFHVLPEFLTGIAGTLLFLLIFPWPAIVWVVVVRVW